ncbi:MAG: glycosyl hydrolase [Spirosomataceae bacterium]
MRNFFVLLCCIVTLGAFAQKKKSSQTTPTPPAPAAIVATNAADRLAGYEKRKQLDAISLVNNVKFRSVGPTVMSGRVADIDVNNTDPTQFFVAYASGGLWKTENNGISFTPLFDNEAVMTLGDVAVDWKTGGKTIWVGTGESISSRSSYSGVGMYKSEDGGKTWQHKGLSDSHHIGEIMLHPTDANTVWVAALGHLYTPNRERGIFKTSDGGKTWKNTLYVDENTGAIDIQIDPTNPKVLYAAMWYKTRRAWNFEEGGKTSGIYKSTDGGDTWKLVSGPGSGFPQGDGNGRIGITVSPSNPNIVYATLDNQARRPEDPAEAQKNANKLTPAKLKALSKEDFLKLDDTQLNEYLDEKRFPEKYTAKTVKDLVKTDKITVTGVVSYTESGDDDANLPPVVECEVYRSDDAGTTWRRTHKDFFQSVFNTYGYVFATIHVSPSNPDKIVIPGFQIIKSEDGGKTFQGINAPNVHADHHVIWMNPKNDKHMILGNDGGLNITYDNGKTWFFANTPAVGQFYAINVDMAKPYNVYGGLQDNGVWYGPSTYRHSYEWYAEGAYPFKNIGGGDGMQVAVDTRDNNIVYTGSQFGFYFRLNKTTGERKFLQIPREIGEDKLRWNWQTPILLSRHNQDIVYWCSNKFHRSLDKGETWKTLSGDLTKGAKQGDVPFGTLVTIDESPLHFGLLYVGSDDGLIHSSKDGGYTWTKISDGLPQNFWVSRVVASTHQEATVYCSLNGYRDDHFTAYAYVSTDYGQTWQRIGEDLPAEPINVIKEDPKNPNLLYIGTDHGLYISLNKGKSFMHMAGELPAVPVHDLVVHPRDNEVVLGTHGRSIWIADVSLVQQLTDSLLAKDIHAFALKTQNANPSWGRQFMKYDEPNAIKYDIPFYLKKADKVTVKIQTDKGLVLRTLTDDSETGLNFVNFDMTLDKAVMADYEKYLNEVKRKDEKAIKVELGQDDKQLYIRPGKYKVVIETTGGLKAEQSLEIKGSERRGRRSVPTAKVVGSPGELEDWMEELGIEEKK